MEKLSSETLKIAELIGNETSNDSKDLVKIAKNSKNIASTLELLEELQRITLKLTVFDIMNGIEDDEKEKALLDELYKQYENYGDSFEPLGYIVEKSGIRDIILNTVENFIDSISN